MYRKLSEEALINLMETGIREFADKGFDKASIAAIAKKADLSAGVIYNYFEGKDDFVLQCVRHSLQPLANLMREIEFHQDDLKKDIELILRTMFRYTSEHSDYFVMYHEITSGGCRKFAGELADEIEAITAGVYYGLIEDARQQGRVRQDMNPALFAFFFDNLLMMLHFSYSCDYYKRRLQVFCRGIPDEEELIQELLKFLTGALDLK